MLRQFWGAAGRGEDKLALLRQHAEIRLRRRSVRSPHAIRREHNAQRLASRYRAHACFLCSGKATQEHHIVQIQHGGTNRPENKVWVCTPCHRDIHPHMALPPKEAPVGVVPHLKGTERESECPACRQPVIAAQPVFKKRRLALAVSRRPILFNAGSTPPYVTTDLHQPSCLAKGVLNRIVAADMGVSARQDRDRLYRAARVSA